MGTIALVALAGCVLSAVGHGIPIPTNHDQFSYLLAAETFASGRFANPTHPHWEFFETFHVIHQPTYVSKYPPGQGLLLALGLWLAGFPILGVWLTSALLPAAVYWAGRQYLPGRWAALAALFTIVQFGLSNYWAQSYWGGNLAGIGGALLIGAARSSVERPRGTSGILIGVALVLLAITRPFEGLLTTVIFGGIWLTQAFKAGDLPSILQRVAPGTLVVLILGGLGLGYYNWRTTGDALLMPYQVHERTYAQSSLLPGGEFAPPEYRHDVIREYNETERRFRATNRDPIGLLGHVVVKAPTQAITLLGAMAIPLLFAVPKLGQLMRRRPELWPLLGSATAVVVTSWFTVGFSHYLAPVVGSVFVIAAGLLWDLHSNRVDEEGWSRVLVWSLLLTGATTVAQVAATVIPAGVPSFGQQRAQLLAELEATPEQDLVFVSYGPGHNIHNEWVYNKADIDQAAVVWARDMGDEANRTLLEYFPERRAWFLESGPRGPRTMGLRHETINLLPYGDR